MNSLIGIFYFLKIPSYEIFSISHFLLTKINLCSLYYGDFQKTFELIEITKSLIEKYNKKLNDWLKHIHMKLDIVLMKWFLTCFTDYIGVDEVKKNFEIFF